MSDYRCSRHPQGVKPRYNADMHMHKKTEYMQAEPGIGSVGKRAPVHHGSTKPGRALYPIVDGGTQ